MPNNLPVLENQYVERGEQYRLPIDDTDFEHQDAWCYPYLKFQIEDVTSGAEPLSYGDPSRPWVSNYIQITPDPILGTFEQYGEEDEWTGSYYVTTAIFKLNTDPMDSYDIRITL